MTGKINSFCFASVLSVFVLAASFERAEAITFAEWRGLAEHYNFNPNSPPAQFAWGTFNGIWWTSIAEGASGGPYTSGVCVKEDSDPLHFNLVLPSLVDEGNKNPAKQIGLLALDIMARWYPCP